MGIRSFIAIDLTSDIKNALSGPIVSLKKSGADVKWVRPESLHITVKFLGSIEEERIQRICARLTGIAESSDDFDFTVAGTGSFPEGRRPRVIWAGLRNYRGLTGIFRITESELEKEGFRPEKRSFIPHITIGRVRSSRGIDNLLSELVKYRHMDFGTQAANEIHLMKSILKPGGAEYHKIFSAQLRR